LPEPQSTDFFLILMAAFGLLAWWLVTARQLVFRILAACLAFIPAVMFGVAAVNKYYDYYQSWGAAVADLNSQRAPAAPAPDVNDRPGVRFGTFLGQTIDTGLAAQQGFTLKLGVTGRLSHLSRTVYVYLPPQYFQPSFRRYRFPVVELLPGYPGSPQDWITVLNVNTTLNSLVSQKLAKPAVLVMPDTEGAPGYRCSASTRTAARRMRPTSARTCPPTSAPRCGSSRPAAAGGSPGTPRVASARPTWACGRAGSSVSPAS
jgi:hypothetical protein